MKTSKFTGIFTTDTFTKHQYEITVRCDSFLQAFFLLTAEAIKSGRHYQLSSVTDERGDVRMIDDINKCTELFNF